MASPCHAAGPAAEVTLPHALYHLTLDVLGEAFTDPVGGSSILARVTTWIGEKAVPRA